MKTTLVGNLVGLGLLLLIAIIAIAIGSMQRPSSAPKPEAPAKASGLVVGFELPPIALIPGASWPPDGLSSGSADNVRLAWAFATESESEMHEGIDFYSTIGASRLIARRRAPRGSWSAAKELLRLRWRYGAMLCWPKAKP